MSNDDSVVSVRFFCQLILYAEKITESVYSDGINEIAPMNFG